MGEGQQSAKWKLQKGRQEPCYLEAYSQSPLILGYMMLTVCNPPIFEACQATVIEPVGALKGTKS